MFKELVIHANFNERTGYGIHASRFFPKLEALVRDAKGQGKVHITLLDSVSVQNITGRYDANPSILYNVWESTEQPQWFIDKLKYFDQLWVPSEWQKAASIAQGIPEEFVKVVPEGVDPEIYKPLNYPAEPRGLFNFVHVGQWQPRKSTQEVIQAYQKAFPLDKDPMGLKTRLHLSVDTLFPSDTYKSTEERLEAYGLQDPRIVVVHFEERADYIRRLQNAHCFVTCARSEGWGLPIIEAMACGVPTIVADWSGSTEYATDCIRIPIKQLIKPYGIYGNWDVPGQWCEPDFDVLVSSMKEVVERYEIAKANALKTSDRIRKDFSWDMAAKKAFTILEELSPKVDVSFPNGGVVPRDGFTKEEMIAYGRRHGWKINELEAEKAVFVIGCWPNSQEKLETLLESITQARRYGYPVIISTHYALPAPICEMVDYVIYEKKNVLSDDWRALYFQINEKGEREDKHSRIPYHGVACLNAIRNAVDFCYGKFDRMFYLEFDSEVDYDKIMDAVSKTDKPMTCVNYEGRAIRTDVWSGELEFLHKNIPIVSSWSEYTAGMKSVNDEYILEDYLLKKLGQNNIHSINIEVGNRFDQVDRTLWDNDMFNINFHDGPFLHITGLSNREYDVSFAVGERKVYNIKQKVGMWAKASLKYFLPWTITASIDGVEKFRHELNLEGKRVLISMGSKALGDTIAWMPYVEEFRKKHKCHVICSGWWQEIFDYPEIEWVNPGTVVENVHALYPVGCFDDQRELNPVNWRECNLQKVAADMLGLKFEPLKAKLKLVVPERNIPAFGEGSKPYICFSEFSTMRNKFWNCPNGWQVVIDHLNSMGYDCVSVSAEPTGLKNVISHNGQPIQKTIEDIKNCAFYVGLNHGPAWVANALDKKCIMITGVSEEWNDFPNPYRIAINHKVCGVGCFNDPSLKIDRSFEWCPRHRDYACTKDITPEMVINVIQKISDDIVSEKVVENLKDNAIEGLNDAIKKGNKQEGNKQKHKGNGGAAEASMKKTDKWFTTKGLCNPEDKYVIQKIR